MTPYAKTQHHGQGKEGVSIKGSNSVTLSPGLYLSGIQISSNANVTFSPSTYVLVGGGLSATSNSTITGTRVTFYNTKDTVPYAPINLTGTETATLSAPTSGALEGMLFFQDRSGAGSGSNGSNVTRNAGSKFNGILYFPTTDLAFTGNSSSSGYLVLVADTLSATGNSSIGSNYSSLANGSPIKASALFE
jgi:hypothetical protein